jgi:hypothetical protein
MSKPTMTEDRLRGALVTVTPRQQIAVELLASGSTHAAAAEAAGVTRERVTIWAGHHRGFRAALDLCRVTLATEQTARMARIREKAPCGDRTAPRRRGRQSHRRRDRPARGAAAVVRAGPTDDHRRRPPGNRGATVADHVPPPTPRSGANGRITRDMAQMDQIMYDTDAEQIVRAERVALETLAEAAGVYDLDES